MVDSRAHFRSSPTSILPSVLMFLDEVPLVYRIPLAQRTHRIDERKRPGVAGWHSCDACRCVCFVRFETVALSFLSWFRKEARMTRRSRGTVESGKPPSSSSLSRRSSGRVVARTRRKVRSFVRRVFVFNPAFTILTKS